MEDRNKILQKKYKAIADDFVITFKDKIINSGGNYFVDKVENGFLEFRAKNIPDDLQQEIIKYKEQKYGK